jgi:hypothetical protein
MPSMSKLMLSILTYALCFLIANVARTAVAEILISVNKSTQQMSVSVDGVPHYRFAVSTGRAGYGTPNGTYRPQRLAASWFSKLYYNSPMPHSIFFHSGYAIHGSYEISRLGGPASHGCIRLHPANAATLFALVKSEGMAATTIVVSGSNPTLAKGPTPSPRYGTWERSSSDDRYRPDDGQPSGYFWRPEQGSDYYWRPKPRVFPFFNSY